jgi:hypothetical protein
LNSRVAISAVFVVASLAAPALAVASNYSPGVALCFAPAFQNEYSTSDVVVLAIALETPDLRQHPTSVLLRVTDAWKGATCDTIRVLWDDMPSAFSLRFETGRRYLIYARYRDDVLWVSFCGRSQLASDALRDRYYLGRPRQQCEDSDTLLVQVSTFIQLLDHPDTALAYRAARDIGEIRAQETVPILKEVLRGERPGYPAYAAMALGMLDTLAVDVFPDLLESLNSPDAGVRRYSAMALSRVSPSKDVVVDPLLDSMKDTDPLTRAEAGNALTSLHYFRDGLGSRTLEFVARLTLHLDDPDRGVRHNAVYNLRILGVDARDAIPRLYEMMEHDPDSDARELAESAVRFIQEEVAREDQ